MNNDTPLLQVKNLSTTFRLPSHDVQAVLGLSLEVTRGQILGIAGESGCGKSATLHSIIRLIKQPGVIEKSSTMLLEGTSLLDLPEKKMAAIRGSQIGMIFQESSASFNPLTTVGSQIAEMLMLHKSLSGPAALQRAAELLDEVRIPKSKERVKDYPFQFSGGMLQRIMIALALSCSPRLLLADEPTTALDPTTQAQIVSMLAERSRRDQLAIIFVTHDLDILAGFANQLLVMYAGLAVEYGPTSSLMSGALHPYTLDLLAAIPRPGMFKSANRLYTIPGKVPEPGNRPTGCPYHPRCSRALDKCKTSLPPLFNRDNRQVRCWLHAE